MGDRVKPDRDVALSAIEENRRLRQVIDALVFAVEASGDLALPTGFEGELIRNLYNLGFVILPRASAGRACGHPGNDGSRCGRALGHAGTHNVPTSVSQGGPSLDAQTSDLLDALGELGIYSRGDLTDRLLARGKMDADEMAPRRGNVRGRGRNLIGGSDDG